MIRIFLLTLVASLAFNGNAQETKQKLTKSEKFVIKTVSKDVKTLSSDKMEGRETGTAGEQMAAEYIAKRMEAMNLKPYGIGGYFQEFTFTPRANPHSKTSDSESKPITGKNVIGFWDNGAENTVVIGAHYDHLGFGEEGSLHAGQKEIHNGADDNASGIAAMLELARVLRGSISAKNNNYLFIAFSGEEKGLWGSKSFVNNPTIPISKINYMINMDMVGRLDSNKLAINGTGTSSEWNQIIEKANIKKLNLVLGKSGIGPSDHTSFYLEGIPVLHFFTGQHSDYHKPGDDFEKVNIEGVVTVSEYIYRVIFEANQKGKLDYKKTKSDKSSKAPKFKVTLGVMPDYMFQGNGMKIDGVIPDRPAEKAGLLKGDIVIKMGDVDIQDMHSYMKGLAQYKAGDKSLVKVKRGNGTLEIEIQF
ncbi:MAG: M20/M25/M40 family metallo-hydrolase [Salibacteraceae bacterium]